MRDKVCRVLIAEDEPLIASFIKKGLQTNGFETIVVSNGNDVVDSIEKNHIDLLILDLGLPGKDGLLILDELRQHGNTLPIVIVTAREGDASRIDSLKRGANDYITKPFRLKHLLDSINRQLGR